MTVKYLYVVACHNSLWGYEEHVSFWTGKVAARPCWVDKTDRRITLYPYEDIARREANRLNRMAGTPCCYVKEVSLHL